MPSPAFPFIAELAKLRKHLKADVAAMAIEITGVPREGFESFLGQAAREGWELERWHLPVGQAAKASAAKGKRTLVSITVTTEEPGL